VSLQEANHNYYNTAWTPPSQLGEDDSTCPGHELTSTQQRDALTAYAIAFYRHELYGEPNGLPVLTGQRPLPGATATVRDCYRNNLLGYALAGNSLGVPEGMRLENPTGPRLRIVTLVQDAGVWKIDQVNPPVVQQRACGSIKDEQKVIDAWKREQRVLRSVYSAKRPNPRDPRLTEVFARQNNALAQVQDKIRTNAKSGRVVRGTSTDAIRAARVELRSYERGKTASIAVCFVDDGAVIDKASGAVLDPPSTTPSLWSFDFAAEGSAWKVTSVAKGEPCVLG